MWAKCMWRYGWLCATVSLALAKNQQPQSFITKNCYSRYSLSQAVDSLYVEAARLITTIPEDRIKNIRLLKKKTKKLFMKSCRFQEQLLSFFMEDVFGQLQSHICMDVHFVEDFHSLRQKLKQCRSVKVRADDDWVELVMGPDAGVLSSHRYAEQLMISCASSAREMNSITQIKRIFYGIGNKGIYKGISELNILLSWIKELLGNIQ